MTCIELKSIDGKLDYARLIRLALDNPPEGGFKLSEMKRRLAIDKALEAAEKSEGPRKMLTLEDEQFRCLQECMAGMRWTSRNPALIEFLELFEK